MRHSPARLSEYCSYHVAGLQALEPQTSSLLCGALPGKTRRGHFSTIVSRAEVLRRNGRDRLQDLLHNPRWDDYTNLIVEQNVVVGLVNGSGDSADGVE